MRRAAVLVLCALMLAAPVAAQQADGVTIRRPQTDAADQSRLRLESLRQKLDTQSRALEAGRSSPSQSAVEESRRRLEENRREMERRELLLPRAAPALQ